MMKKEWSFLTATVLAAAFCLSGQSARKEDHNLLSTKESASRSEVATLQNEQQASQNTEMLQERRSAARRAVEGDYPTSADNVMIYGRKSAAQKAIEDEYEYQ